jgi:hypothetical protein
MRGRRRLCAAACALAAVTALGACKREPSFDERYASAQKAVRDKSRELDQDMARRAAEARSVEPAASDSATYSAESKI